MTLRQRTEVPDGRDSLNKRSPKADGPAGSSQRMRRVRGMHAGALGVILASAQQV